MYESELIKSGLTEKQAKVYLACLSLGRATIPKLARSAGLKRTTAYGIIDELVASGLVRSINTGKSRLYEAGNPEKLLSLLEFKKRSLSAALPGLTELFETHNIRPQVEFFQGLEGIKKIYEDILNSGTKKVLQIVKNTELQNQGLDPYSTNYVKKRVEKGITAFDLHPKSGALYTPERGTTSEKYKRYVRYLPPEVFSAAMIIIYVNKVAMISTQKENFGFILESKEFSSTIRSFFEFMWKLGSKEPDIDSPALF